MKRPTAFDEAARARKNGTSINLHVALYAITGSCGSTWFGKISNASSSHA